MKLIDRFLAYVQQDTRSNPESETVPSTPTQLVFAQALADELRGIGLRDVQLDTNGYIMATLPANTSEAVPVIGFIAHMDTSPDMSGKDVRPQIIRNYPGGDIVLDSTNGVILSPENFPELLGYVGQDLVCTDGTTLLGADDKAGIAEIVSAMEYLMEHPGIKHGTIRIGFTPDEEIGRGADHFDVAAFGADWAYTLDGGEIGELEFENFNAAGAKVVFKGRNVHPGYAKGKMINAAVLAMRFAGLMPEKETPEQTEGYEGFFHLTHFKGDVEQAELNYIVRDHDRARFEKRKGVLQRWTDLINDEYDSEVVQLFLTDQYYNMREKIEP
ncbi:MAG: peptidase T, partial [Bacteroidales bacterium]|nr:peptidase T [Bacteroidales bacterium]